MKVRFSSALKLFRCLEILTRAASQVIDTFGYTLVGISLAIYGGYTAIALYEDFPLSVYIPSVLIFPFIMGLIFILHFLADITYTNGEHFKEYWKFHLRTKRERRQLGSCRRIGFSYATIKIARKETALAITDFVINQIVSFGMLRLEEAKSV